VKLEEFVAYKNKLRVLPASFTDLISLKELNFYNNVLEELPRDLTKLTNLETLNFANNPLLELPALAGLTKLTSIKCHMCNIELIEGSWESLESLEELMFNSNAITDIPKMPAGVQELDFVRCKLTSVHPSRLELCKVLKEFKANTCQLTEFPAGALVESMESFGISGNPGVTDLPLEIGNCVNMLTFVINGTGITKLPKEMMKMTKLTRLNVQSCPLDLTDEGTKAVLEQLKEQCSGRDENGKAKGYFKA
jgi:leucine-rich repeat protein SHOC2